MENCAKSWFKPMKCPRHSEKKKLTGGIRGCKRKSNKDQAEIERKCSVKTRSWCKNVKLSAFKPLQELKLRFKTSMPSISLFPQHSGGRAMRFKWLKIKPSLNHQPQKSTTTICKSSQILNWTFLYNESTFLLHRSDGRIYVRRMAGNELHPY